MFEVEGGLVLNRPVILVGLMGAGKTSLGKRLAKRLGVAFKDSDDEIESAANCTVAEYFARHGEADFRAKERAVIARLLISEPQVVALGGGAFVDAGTRALVAAHGFAIWLKASTDTLVMRTSRRPGKRPLLTKGDPRVTLQNLAEIRDPFYAEAKLVIETDNGQWPQMIEFVVEGLKAAKILEVKKG